MTHIKKTLFAMLAIGFALNSCTVEKRKHLSGYHIEWNRSANTASKTQPVQQIKPIGQIQLSNHFADNYHLKTEVSIPDKNLTASITKNQMASTKNDKMPTVLKNEIVHVENESHTALHFSKSGSELPAVKKEQIKSKLANNFIYKLLVFFGIGVILQKLHRAIKQNQNAAHEKKKNKTWVLILLLVALLLALAVFLTTLAAL